MDPQLKLWLERQQSFVSKDVQNEISNLYSYEVLSTILSKIRGRKFSIMADATTDLSKQEQFSLCLRYVNDELQVVESFVGFYELSLTERGTLCDGEALLCLVKDALLRFNLNLRDCRGHGYDGAANMSGRLNGLAAKFSSEVPEAIYVHCTAHSLDLVVQEWLRTLPGILCTLETVKEVYNLLEGSAKRHAVFEACRNATNNTLSNLRPLCPTRWIMRGSAIHSLLENYESVIVSLNVISKDKSEAAAKAVGLINQLHKFNFIFHILLLEDLIPIFETLSRKLQTVGISYHTVRDEMEVVVNLLNQKRTESSSERFWSECIEWVDKEQSDALKLPKQRRRPLRFDDGQDSYEFTDVKLFYRRTYYEIIDLATNVLADRFDNEKFKLMHCIERVLMSSCDENNDGNEEELVIILNFYRNDFADARTVKRHLRNLTDATKGKCIKSIPDLVKFFHAHTSMQVFLEQAFKMLEIYLVVPFSVATNERTFSCLRRLKSYLRTCMTSNRLNSCAMMHIHSDILKNVDISCIARQFVLLNSKRIDLFGMI